MTQYMTPRISLTDVLAHGSVSESIITWASMTHGVSSGDISVEDALAAGAMVYIDAGDGRAIGQVTPTDDTPEDDILMDIGGVRYMVGDWTGVSVVELIAPTIEQAIDHPDEAREMIELAQGVHRPRSDQRAWAILASQLDELEAPVQTLRSHGDMFSGGDSVADVARAWLDAGMDDADIDAWCSVGVWEPDCAEAWADAGLSPHDVSAAAARLRNAAGSNARDTYTAGDPVYACCNGDLDPDVIVLEHRRYIAD